MANMNRSVSGNLQIPPTGAVPVVLRAPSLRCNFFSGRIFLVIVSTRIYILLRYTFTNVNLLNFCSILLKRIFRSTFWLGDLNFRVEKNSEDVVKLLKENREGILFALFDFKESIITFKPTYRYISCEWVHLNYLQHLNVDLICTYKFPEWDFMYHMKYNFLYFSLKVSIEDCTTALKWVWMITCYEQTVRGERYVVYEFTDLPEGRYRLGYYSSYNKCLIGISKSFQVRDPSRDYD
uniref:SKICH domain-containing protein n=1 Tax=Heterorhabditis bacteriophora TaxID=37862 RepID=A0A1I7X577_HETBA